jgi:Domain of unknown function (DUF1905)
MNLRHFFNPGLKEEDVMSELPVKFAETVRKSEGKGGWTYLIWPGSAAHFGTRARVKVRGAMDGEPFESSFMPLGDGNHKLPVTGEMLARLKKAVGDVVNVAILERR